MAIETKRTSGALLPTHINPLLPKYRPSVSDIAILFAHSLLKLLAIYLVVFAAIPLSFVERWRDVLTSFAIYYACLAVITSSSLLGCIFGSLNARQTTQSARFCRLTAHVILLNLFVGLGVTAALEMDTNIWPAKELSSFHGFPLAGIFLLFGASIVVCISDPTYVTAAEIASGKIDIKEIGGPILYIATKYRDYRSRSSGGEGHRPPRLNRHVNI